MIINKEKGQALLIVVLIMVVALTVGLSLAGRSIVNIRTSTEEADSQKALSAAEAGIEQALQINTNDTITKSFTENASSYKTEIKGVNGTARFLANGGNIAVQDDGVDVWLVEHDADGKPNYPDPPATGWNGDLTIYWGDPSMLDCNNAAVEVAVVSGTMFPPPPDLKLKRYVYDPCSDRRKNNKFDIPTSTVTVINGITFKYNITTASPISSGLVARVVPIYSSSAIGVYGNGAFLPTQGYSIGSTGTAGTGDRQVVKSIDYFKAYTQLAAPYFTYGLFSP